MAEYWVEFVASSEGILWQEIHLLKPIAWSTILYPYPHPKYNYWSVGFFVLVFEESRGKGKRITVREIDRWVVAKYLLIKEGVLQFQVLKKKKKKKNIYTTIPSCVHRYSCSTVNTLVRFSVRFSPPRVYWTSRSILGNVSRPTIPVFFFFFFAFVHPRYILYN